MIHWKPTTWTMLGSFMVVAFTLNSSDAFARSPTLQNLNFIAWLVFLTAAGIALYNHFNGRPAHEQQNHQ